MCIINRRKILRLSLYFCGLIALLGSIWILIDTVAESKVRDSLRRSHDAIVYQTFVTDGLNQIPKAGHNVQNILIMDTDLETNELTLALNRGYRLILLDDAENKYDSDLLFAKYPDKVKILQQPDFDALPILDVLIINIDTSSYDISKLKKLWFKIGQKLNNTSYVISSFYIAEDNKNIGYDNHDILKLFHNYEILKLERSHQNHGNVYSIFAQKDRLDS